MTDLDRELDPETRTLLERYGFERKTFELLRERLRSGYAEETHNRLERALDSPAPSDVVALPPLGSARRSQLHERGLAELRAGRVATVVLAGGMATRFGGVVKAAVPVLEQHTFLDLKLRDFARVAHGANTPLRVYLMTSFATHEEVSRMARASDADASSLRVQAFPQFVSLRLSADGGLFRDGAGNPSPYAPGHGDLPFALRRAGILRELAQAGVRHLYMSNVDNLAATLDPAILGLHVERELELSFEVTALLSGDKGGVPARVDGKLQVVEALRYPAGFDERSIPLFSTNSFVFDVAALDRQFELTWLRVTKQVDGRPAIQFERLVNELSAFVTCGGVTVERAGADGRFLPVKDPPELVQRLPEIERVLRARGALA